MQRSLLLSLVLCVFCADLFAAGTLYPISVNANSNTGVWRHFYEESIGTCHPITILSSSYGRDIRNAMRRAHQECGIKRFRAHGIFNRDIGLYSESNGTAVYTWTKFDQVFDSALAAGMTPIVELSFMPQALAAAGQTSFWYNGAAAYISPPKDYAKWRDLVKAVVQHLETRYGAAEVRNNWYFEVWNEPDLGGFWSGTQDDYFRLYDYAAEGVRLADPDCRVGGPITSGNEPAWVDAWLNHVVNGTNYATNAKGSKADFVCYHRYSDDPGYGSQRSRPGGLNDYYKAIVDYAKKYSFAGPVICTEWAPTWQSLSIHSDEECAASFVAKTIHLLASNGAAYPPPPVYSWWCLSDIFEEWNAWSGGTKTAFDGSYGMMLRGESSITDSWDVPKSEYNAFRLLHSMGDISLTLTGGTIADGVNGFATTVANHSSVQVMLYNHVDGGTANSALADTANLTVSNLAFASGRARLEYWLIDRTHSSAYRLWQGLGAPVRPTAQQWTQIKAAAALTAGAPTEIVAITNGTFSRKYTLNTYSVAMISLTDTATIAVREPLPRWPEKRVEPAVHAVSGGWIVELAERGAHAVQLIDACGRTVFSAAGSGPASYRIGDPGRASGMYLLSIRTADGSRVRPLIAGR